MLETAAADVGPGYRLGQSPRARSARPGQVGQMPEIHLSLEMGHHARDVLISQHAEYRVRVRRISDTGQIVFQRRGRVRIVGNIENDKRATRQ